MKITAKTDKGLVRPTNEDYYGFEILSDNFSYAVVCDGMGGHKAGNIASKLAVDTITQRLRQAFKEKIDEDKLSDLLAEVIQDANSKIFAESQNDKELAGMGTTVVAVVIKQGLAHISNVGDSRVYSLSRGGIKQLTHDHSYVQTLVDIGHISQEEALTHPKRNMITRAIGVDENVQVDYLAYPLEEDSVLLLCSDGLTNFVSDYIILQTLDESLEKNEFETYADRLVDLANENGGGDNITAVAIWNKLDNGGEA